MRRNKRQKRRGNSAVNAQNAYGVHSRKLCDEYDYEGDKVDKMIEGQVGRSC